MVKLEHVTEKVIISTMVTSVALAVAPMVTEANTDLSTEQNISTTNQLLQVGHQGKDVKSLQITLTEKKYFRDKHDGIFGPVTEISVRQFQKDHQLAVDGIAGPNTLSALFSSSVKDESEQTYQVTFLQQGDEGPKVKRLQENLKESGFYFSSIDGKFGPQTEKALKDYQETHGLTIDGIAGPQTLNHLSGVKVTIENDLVKPNQSSKIYSPSNSTNPSPMIIDQTKELDNDNDNDNDKKATDQNKTAHALIASAESLIGTPYRWGGTTPNGFDCSGFIGYVFKKNGNKIPRTVAEIWNHATKIKKPQPGDLVFFETYKPGPSHAGIYIGDDQFIHAGSSKGVTISSLDKNYWSSRYLGAKTISN